jgi:putative chitinase
VSFQFNFTEGKLAQCFPANPRASEWFPWIAQTLQEYHITTINRVGQWLAQMGHESGDLRHVVENLNYSADALLRTWPRHFPTRAIANSYARQPQRIANRAYASRMGNGPESSGDGWKFRGRGLIQITGKSNYADASMALYGDLVLLDEPEILQEFDGAVRSACWYWNSRRLNLLSDAENTREVTRLINGGFHGLDDRMNRYARIKRILAG